MMTAALLVALVGVAVTGTGGYLVGVALGRRARKRLAAQAEGQGQRIEQLQLALAHEQSSASAAAGVRDQLQSMLAGWMGQQQASAEQLQAQIRQQMETVVGQLAAGERSDGDVERMRQEIHQALAPMLERDRDQKGLRELVLDVLGPMMESERRAQGLKSLRAPLRGREQLPALLDNIARRGGFAAVLLSDEVGLPLAASSGARNADVLAGVSSLILSLADRVTKSGAPTPTAVLVRDGSNQLILHRIFSAAGERFLLTGVSKGSEVPTTALDPVLTALEDVLAKSQAA